MRSMSQRHPTSLAFNLRTLFAVTAVVAVVAAGPYARETFGPWWPIVGVLMFWLIVAIATGKWPR